MKKIALYLSLCCATSIVSSDVSAQTKTSDAKETQIKGVLQKIEQQQKQMQESVEQLKELIGIHVSLDTIALQPTNMASQKLEDSLKTATQLYADKKYEEAKKIFYDAWEQTPESAPIQFNLALCYYHLGNIALTKKMFQSALKIDPHLPHADLIESFINNKTSAVSHKTPIEEEPAEVKQIRTELLNKQKEVSSYIKSTLPIPQKTKTVLTLLDEIYLQGQVYESLVRDYFLWLAENYAVFEYYTSAVEVLKKYEGAMQGKELPDGYHSKKLHLQQQLQQQQQRLQIYLNNQADPAICKKLQKDQEELAIFAVQMDQFVTSLAKNDPDLDNLCHRLREFKWGKKSARHVLIIDRYQNIIFSSLLGTLSLDRYQDVQGRKFFHDITLLWDKLILKQVEFIDVELQINNSVVPYIVLYTYVPKHQVFIIVRLLKSDLSLS